MKSNDFLAVTDGAIDSLVSTYDIMSEKMTAIKRAGKDELRSAYCRTVTNTGKVHLLADIGMVAMAFMGDFPGQVPIGLYGVADGIARLYSSLKSRSDRNYIQHKECHDDHGQYPAGLAPAPSLAQGIIGATRSFFTGKQSFFVLEEEKPYTR